MGFAGTIMLVANQTSLAELHGEARTVALAESNVAASSAAILAPIAIGGFDSVGLSWQLGVVVAAPALLVLGLLFRGVEVPERVEAVRSATGSEKLPVAFWWFAATLFFASAVEWCIGYWGADFLTTEVGLKKSSAATAMSVFFAAMVAGRLFGARLTRRYASTSLLLGALVVAGVGFPIFWLGGSSLISLIGLFISGIGIANFYPLTVGTAASVAPELASQATSRLAVSGGLAMLSMPLLVGALSDGFGLRGDLASCCH